MSTIIATTLAELVKRAAEIREASWDAVAYKSASETDQMSQDFYGISHFEAATQVCDKEHELLITPVFLLIYNAWNQAVEWAESILNSDEVNNETR